MIVRTDVLVRLATSKVKTFGKRKTVLNVKNKVSPLYALKLPRVLPKLAVGENDVSQAVAKTLLPPTHTVWRANYRGQWAFHPRPHRRFQEAWVEHGGDSYKALVAGVRRCWKTWLADQRNLTDADCPIEGLM